MSATARATDPTPPPPARRDALVAAAFALIADHGFEGLRLRQVAAAVGIDQSTLHHYFATKQDLVDAVVVHATGQFRATMAGADSGSPAVGLRERLAQLGRIAQERPELFLVLRELDLRSGRDPAVRAIVEEREHGWRVALARMLREADHPSDPDTVELIIATVKGVSFRPAAARAVLDRLADLLVPTIGSPQDDR